MGSETVRPRLWPWAKSTEQTPLAECLPKLQIRANIDLVLGEHVAAPEDRRLVQIPDGECVYSR